jgi:hypothetical protein
MRELQNFSICLIMLIMAVVFISTTNAETPSDAVKKKPAHPEEVCWRVERFTFDEPGVGALETKTPMKCKGVLSYDHGHKDE